MVSIIVPIYNTEKYLDKCVESIMRQTYTNTEIILVDDGSTDNSGIMCDKFARKDDRIKVIHKINGGLVSARKAGLEIANGEYILNIDSDDWIETAMVEELLKIAERYDVDIVTSGLIREEKGFISIVVDEIEEGLFQDKKIAEVLMPNLIYSNETVYHGILPNVAPKLIRRELLAKSYLYVKDAIRNGEDAAITYICGCFAEKVYITKKTYYHYVMRDDSMVHSTDMYYLSGLNELYVCVYNAFCESKYKVELLPQLTKYLILNSLSGINTNMQCSNNFYVPAFRFKSSLLVEKQQIILYGAGEMGKCFYKQLKQEGYSVILWVDEQYKKYRLEGYDVRNVSSINTVSGKYTIVIAVKHKRLAESIKNELCKKYGVSSEDLLWSEPISIV